MPSKVVKTEAVVLRSIRYGESDRILHLYSPTLGRAGAIAKGVRKPRSRFGGRLEPFFRLELTLHRGRGDLATVSSASTIDGFPRLRSSAIGLGAAARACDSVSRLFETEDPSSAAYNLLCRYLELLDTAAIEIEAGPDDERAGGGNGGSTSPAACEESIGLARAVSFRLKLALAAGFSPELAACARCGDRAQLAAFSGAAGGAVCSGCERDSFPLSAEAHTFMVDAIGRPLASVPSASTSAVRQADRAVGEVLEHHAHVRLRAVA